MSRSRILITNSNTDSDTDILDSIVKLLQAKHDVTIIKNQSTTREEVLQALPGMNAVLLTGHHNVNSEFLNVAGPNLKIICTMSTGYDNLDIPEIKRRGIKVCNTSKIPATTVSEIAVMLLLSAARRAYEGRLKINEGKVKNHYQWLLGQNICESTVGIVGFGNIGQAVAKRLKGFEVNRIFYTGHSRKKAGDELGAEFISLDELLQQSDFVIVAAPLTNETRGLFNDTTFNKMKKNAVFVNIGRGQIVDTDSLVRALKNKTIFAAGLDVTDPEPLPTDHELLTLPNAVITPHLGSATIKTRYNMAFTAAQNILNGLEGKPLLYEL